VGQRSGTEPHRLLDVLRSTAGHAATLGRLLLLPMDPKTPLSGTPGEAKRLAWTRAVPLGTLAAAAKRHGAKINDIVLAAAAGAARSYLRGHGHTIADEEVRALVPVFFQGTSSGETLGNHFGLIYANLPIGLAEPASRLAETKRRMDAIKTSDEATVAFEVLGAMGLASADVERLGIDLFTRKATLMITNVPGPSRRLHFRGHPLADLVVWAPVSGQLGVGLSFITYAGAARIGVLTDARIVPEPMVLVEALEHELEALSQI
jgi:diacylglycerol O-acyltransferase / wax synthase